MADPAPPVLRVEGLDAGYPGKQVLSQVSFTVQPGEVVSLLGANGSGKSTVLKVVSGFVRPLRGVVEFAGASVAGVKPHAIFRRGIAHVAQSRDLFGEMSVEDNLRLGASRRGQATRAEAMAECYALFPRLAERRTQRVRLMSGGEQQMVAIGRALVSRPVLLLLDEPSGGLAPLFVDEIGRAMQRLRVAGMTMLLVEQNIKLALAVADRFLVLRDGTVADHGDLREGGASGAGHRPDRVSLTVFDVILVGAGGTRSAACQAHCGLRQAGADHATELPHLRLEPMLQHGQRRAAHREGCPGIEATRPP